jgi:hypothetical protein
MTESFFLIQSSGFGSQLCEKLRFETVKTFVRQQQYNIPPLANNPSKKAKPPIASYCLWELRLKMKDGGAVYFTRDIFTVFL